MRLGHLAALALIGLALPITLDTTAASTSTTTTPPYRTAVVLPDYQGGHLAGLTVQLLDADERRVFEARTVVLELYTDEGEPQAGRHPRPRDARFQAGGYQWTGTTDHDGTVFVPLVIAPTPGGLRIVSTPTATAGPVSSAPQVRHVERQAGGG